MTVFILEQKIANSRKKCTAMIFLHSGVRTIDSKINVLGSYLPISKLHSILAVANLLAHNNISQICYCG